MRGEVIPTLCEPGVKYFVSNTLKECHIFKERHLSFFFNIAMTILLIISIGGFLFYRSRSKKK